MAKKQFTVELTTKGAFDIEIFPLDTEIFDIDYMTEPGHLERRTNGFWKEIREIED